MRQLTLRLPQELIDGLKTAAAARGSSLNRWAGEVLAAAIDPELAGDEAERIRERLRRAGLLIDDPAPATSRPDRRVVAHARAAAGRGTALSELIGRERD